MRDGPRSSRDEPGAPRPRRLARDQGWLASDDLADPFATSRMPAARDDAQPVEEAIAETRGEDGLAPRVTLPSIPVPGIRPTRHGETTERHRTLRTGATSRHAALPRPDHMPELVSSEDVADARHAPTRPRERTVARPLRTTGTRLPAVLSRPLRRRAPNVMPAASVPDLAAYKQANRPRRPRVNTRALVQSASSPWSLVRAVLTLVAITLALSGSLVRAGEPSQPLMAFQAGASSHDAKFVVSMVKAETQGKRPDLYDSYAQFNDWWDAACSAAVSSEVLTAWGVPHATIGKLIDVMQPDISLNGGLLRPEGFQRGATAFGYRADINWHLTYKQMLYITNVLGLPVIVNVRIAYGYYHFFDTGHFLVMTGGDAQGVKIVDSSEYYITYLPLDTFYSMFTGMTVVLVPNGYQYTVPS